MSKQKGTSSNGKLVSSGSSWIVPDSLEERINADFYAPEYLLLERSLRASPNGCVRLGSMIKKPFKGAFYVLASEYSSEGVPFLRVGDITKGHVNLDNCVYLPRHIHEREKKTSVRPGSLLFAKGGSIGNCAVVPDWLAMANISQDLIGAAPKPDLDPYFANALLIGKFGIPQMLRWIQRATHPHLSNESICNVLVPSTELKLQRAVGHKVRAAERLRATAESRVRGAIRELETALGWPISLDQSQITYAPPSEIGKRIDALPYLPRFIAVRNLLKSHGAKTLEQIGATAVNGCENRDFVTTGQRYLIVGDMESWHLKSPSEWACIPQNADVPDKARPEEGDLLCIRTGPVGYMVSWEPCYGNAVLSSHWIRIRGEEEDGFDAGYMAILSQLPAWQIMMQAIVYGAVQPQISQEEILDVPVPFIGTDLAKRCSQSYRQSVADAFRAKKLVQDAIADVENLIDGKLDEDQCLVEGRKLAEEFGLEVP